MIPLNDVDGCWMLAVGPPKKWAAKFQDVIYIKTKVFWIPSANGSDVVVLVLVVVASTYFEK